MNSIKNMKKYAQEMGAVFSYGEVVAIPYNHWKKDYEWLVFIMADHFRGAFVPVYALTPEEACNIAIKTFSFNQKEEENDI